MDRIYLDPNVVTIDIGRDASPQPAPGVADALGHLADAAFEVLVIADEPPRVLADLPVEVRAVPGLPDGPAHGSWLVTDDPEKWHRLPPGLRTIFVGPKRPPSNRPLARCDVEARDLRAAVFEILTRQAMG